MSNTTSFSKPRIFHRIWRCKSGRDLKIHYKRFRDCCGGFCWLTFPLWKRKLNVFRQIGCRHFLWRCWLIFWSRVSRNFNKVMTLSVCSGSVCRLRYDSVDSKSRVNLRHFRYVHVSFQCSGNEPWLCPITRIVYCSTHS